MLLILVIELLNSAVEATVDRIGVERHPLSGNRQGARLGCRVRRVHAPVPQLAPGARMAALICGSLAYDTVMVYPGRFRDHILPDKIHLLNVSFVVPTLRRNFGGCAGNIAYNLRLLDCPGHAMGTVGHDFGPYREWMTQSGMSLRHVRELAGRVHGPGLHHDRPRREPADSVPSGRDDALGPASGARGRRHHARRLRARRARRHDRARRAVHGARTSPSSSTRARR